MWARVHKLDKIKPQPDGSAIILIEDERNVATISRVAGLSTVVAIARVLNSRRVLDAKFNGKGSVRYATAVSLPSFMLEAIARAGGEVADSTGDRVRVPASPASVSAVVDHAMAELAHYTRTNVGAPSIQKAIDIVEANRRKTKLDRDANTAQYWTAVFELAALAGELSRPRGGMWIETKDMPVPFAIRLSSGEVAMPTKLAMRIVEGASYAEESVADTPGVGERP